MNDHDPGGSQNADGGGDDAVDNDRTVIGPSLARPMAQPPAVPRAASQATQRAEDPDTTLQIGTLLGEFEVTQHIGEGGFSFVYLAQDHSLGRRVALKEYMPMSLATRSNNTQISVKSERYRETFDAGLKSFINEARLLASFDHPSLVKVYRFWEANGTAYMVMPFYEGITVKTRLAQLGGPPDEAWLLALLAPLTEALEVIHTESCYHRDIAPDNIILLANTGKPLLLDFGAARRVIGDMTQALTVILKPGYAPVEQYGASPSMKQGPWTDVYALCAVVYQAIAGKTPPPSVGRMLGDSYEPLETIGAGRYSEHVLRAIDRGLRVRPEDRTQTISQLRAELGLAGEVVVPPTDLLTPSALMPGASFVQEPTPAAVPSREATPTASPPAPPPPRAPRQVTLPGEGQPMPKVAPPPERSSKTGLWVGLGALGLVAVGVGGYVAMGSGGSGTPAVVASAPAGSAVAPAPEASSPAAPPASAAASSAAAPAPPPAPFSVAGEFDKLMRAQTPGFTVEATPAKTAFRIGRDSLSFKLKSSRDGFVYLLLLGPDKSLVRLFPNAKSGNNRIKANQELTLPQASWPLVTGEPAGPETFVVIVSSRERDFSGVSKQRDNDMYGALKLPIGDAGAALAAAHTGAGSVYAGRAQCEAEPCADEYAATQFTVDVVR